MLNLVPENVTIPGVEQALLESRFASIRNRVLENGETITPYAVSVYLPDAFAYVNERLENEDPITVPPILIYLATADDLLNRKVVISGPNGFFVVIVSEEPFGAPEGDVCSLILSVCKELLPDHIIGLDGEFLYIDGQVFNIVDFTKKGVLEIRCATLSISNVDTKEFAKNLVSKLVENFCYNV